jgi:hypothetical protein
MQAESRLRASFLGLLLVPLVLGAIYLQWTRERPGEPEHQDKVRETTVTVLTDNEATPDPVVTHTLTGLFIALPETIYGDECINFYPEGTRVVLADSKGDVLGKGTLGAGRVVENDLCAQAFQIALVPERQGYIVYFERRTPVNTYEFTLDDVQASDWHIEVLSRYRASVSAMGTGLVMAAQSTAAAHATREVEFEPAEPLSRWPGFRPSRWLRPGEYRVDG